MENKEFELQEMGAILDENTISKNDFLLGNIDEKTLDEYLNKTQADNPIHFYNQAEIRESKPYKDTRWSCVLFGNMGALSDLTGYKFTKEDILEIQKEAVDNYKLKVPGGMYIHRGVDCVRKYWNKKNPNKEVVTFRIDLRSQKDLDIIKKLYSKGKTLVIGYRTTREHYEDSQDNGILDKSCFVSCGAKVTGGHCIRFNKGVNVDNYDSIKKHNAYVNEKLVGLAKEGTYFPSAYVYFYKDEFESIFKDVQEGAAFFDSIKWAKENGIVNGYNDGTFRSAQNISRGELIGVLKNYDDYLKNQNK